MGIVDTVIFTAIFVTAVILFSLYYPELKKRSTQTNERRKAYSSTEHIDELTGLPDMHVFASSVPDILKKYPNKLWAIIDFDINYFAHYNAIYGFHQGDELLRRIADISRACCLNDGEICAHIHADHFVCLATDKNIQAIKTRILAANQSFRNTPDLSLVMLSYGIYEIKDKSIPAIDMCDKALAAKRTIKGNYDNTIAVYNELLHRRQIEDSELISSMDSGIRNKEFMAFYQPKYDIQTKRIVGAEALVRWKHFRDDIIPPARFIHLFENNGLIGRLDMYMLDMVCRTLRRQMIAGIRIVPISVNFSRTHLFDERFLAKLKAIVEMYNIPTHFIELELTETTFVENDERLQSLVNQLHETGFLVSIDDFGSGYSSLNILKDLNFDIVKLDRGFLATASNNERGRKIIRSVLSMAKELNLTTVAEGVETKEQFEFLEKCGCDIIQGFYFAKPMPIEEYDKLLAETI